MGADVGFGLVPLRPYRRDVTTEPQGFLDFEPRHVAVLMVDLQNDFCSPEIFASTPVTNTHNAATAHRANAFAQRAATAGAKVIYTQQVLDLDRLNARQRRAEEHGGICLKGTWGAELFVETVPGSTVSNDQNLWMALGRVNVKGRTFPRMIWNPEV